MKKYLPTILIVLVIVIVAGFIVRALMTPDSQTKDTKSQPITQADTDALRQGGSIGNPNSKVLVTEFGDYQCPACGAWHPYIKDTIIPQYQDKIFFVFKNFPLEMHKNAQASAQAVEAAALQGKFWEMHNIVYENQKEWVDEKDPNSKFEGYARQIGLNVDQWKKDRDTSKVKDLIKADVTLGEKLNLPGTPAFLINGTIVQVKSFEDLKNAIDQALAQNQ
ncbi:thioredoxin domain-containing protein [Candidatus Saccharibacteria bacterium]|nr:thioredoxin domain-containing protein [Candidatus Saccharibacteria bacterium]